MEHLLKEILNHIEGGDKLPDLSASYTSLSKWTMEPLSKLEREKFVEVCLGSLGFLLDRLKSER